MILICLFATWEYVVGENTNSGAENSKNVQEGYMLYESFTQAVSF